MSTVLQSNVVRESPSKSRVKPTGPWLLGRFEEGRAFYAKLAESIQSSIVNRQSDDDCPAVKLRKRKTLESLVEAARGGQGLLRETRGPAVAESVKSSIVNRQSSIRCRRDSSLRISQFRVFTLHRVLHFCDSFNAAIFWEPGGRGLASLFLGGELLLGRKDTQKLDPLFWKGN
jgi:hypothetical protein